MAKSTAKDAQALVQSLRSAYSATPSNLKIIDLYVIFAVLTAVIQVGYMAIVGSFPFNSFLSGVLSCIGTAVLAVCLRIQVNKENKEFWDLPPERAFADFVLCNLVLHLVIMNFLGDYTGYPKDLGPSQVIPFTSERQFVQLLHEGHPVVVAFTIQCTYTKHLDQVLEEAAAEFYPDIKFVRVECPKYPGFCITRQKKDYPFIEIFHNPEQPASQPRKGGRS